MSNLENTVRDVIDSFVKQSVLFTALDVSNIVKQILPQTRHREVRDIVRADFSYIEPLGYAKTPITVSLQDGSTAEAMLYHPTSDSWDLDNKYTQQQRSAVSTYSTSATNLPPNQAVGVLPVADPQISTIPVTTSPIPAHLTAQSTSVPICHDPTVTVAPLSPSDQWAALFGVQPSLFPQQ